MSSIRLGSAPSARTSIRDYTYVRSVCVRSETANMFVHASVTATYLHAPSTDAIVCKIQRNDVVVLPQCSTQLFV
eukprot:scaffold310_cov335-Pavlova_lutheri.AAC.25